MTRDRPHNLRRSGTGTARVTNIEPFFDLVYVFAVTQLSHYLIDHPTVGGALQALLLLALVSLVMSAALPDAFGGRGLAVGIAYAGMQIGRSVFAVAGLRGDPLRRNFQRILAWCVVSGALAVAGGLCWAARPCS